MCEQTPTLAQERAPSIGELDMPAGAVKQRHAELLLESADLVTQRGLGDVQPLGGPAEVKLLGDGDEVLHEPQVQAFDRRSLVIAPDSGSPSPLYRTRPIGAVY